MPDPDLLAARLRRIPASDAVRASAWDAFHDATDQDDLEKRLRGLSIPDDAKADLWDMKAGRAAAPPPVGVKADGETFADKLLSAASVLGHGSLGVAKGAARSALNAAESGLNAGVIPGGVPGQPNAAIDYLRQGVQPDDTAESVGGWLETGAELAAPAMEAGKLAIAGGRALATKAAPLAARAAAEASPALTRIGNSTVLDVASHVPGVGTPVHWARTGAKLLGRVLDMAAEKAPPSAMVPGRIVPAQTPTLTQALTDSLEAVRAEPLPSRVTLPPEPSLPPGYTPRTTVPKPKAVKMSGPAPSAYAPAAEPTKRAYFLKSEADLAAPTSAASPAATGTIEPDALPAAWQSHIGQDLFPLTGEEGKAVADALAGELRSRGLSVGQAMMAVSKNPDIPVQFRQQILKSLSRVNMKGAS